MDIISYIIGQKRGEKEGEETVNIDSDYIFKDTTSDGDITIEKEINSG